MRYNLILDTDSYKLSHFTQYPKTVEGLSAYIEARGIDPYTANEYRYVIPFGLQMFIKQRLLTPITKEDIDEAAAFATAHGEPFNKEGWEYILQQYKGFLPIQIHAAPEGQPIPIGHVLVRVDCTDPKVFWLATYIETALQRSFWYATTVATNSHSIRKVIKLFLHDTADNLDGLDFKLHDFGARGVSSEESAQYGGAAHLVNFRGSDTISGIRAANYYYNTNMAAFSVPAAEHSTMTAWGKDREKEAFEHMLNTFGGKFPIVSVVSDAYDIFNAIDIWGSLRDKVLASGSLLVIRPDSGDPVDTVLKVIRRIESWYGATTNSKGFKVLNGVRVLQGDGIDKEMVERILFNLRIHRYSADNMVFGSGGALLQKVNRDTYKFAMKGSAVLVNGAHGKYWEPISKDPVTDKGKKSKGGLLELYRSRMTGGYLTLPKNVTVDEEFVPVLRLVYDTGKLLVDESLDEIRQRANG